MGAVKARDTYSLATVAITLLFNISSDRLAQYCHVSSCSCSIISFHVLLIAFIIWKHVSILCDRSGTSQKSWIQLPDTSFMM